MVGCTTREVNCWEIENAVELTFSMLQESISNIPHLVLRNLVQECVSNNTRGVFPRDKASDKYHNSVAATTETRGHILPCNLQPLRHAGLDSVINMNGSGRPFRGERGILGPLLFANSEGTEEALFDLRLNGSQNKNAIGTSFYTYRANSCAWNVFTPAVEFGTVTGPCNEPQERVLVDDIIKHPAGSLLFSKK
jgi:hypothetical protein